MRYIDCIHSLIFFLYKLNLGV